jgi:hypothetical protein
MEVLGAEVAVATANVTIATTTEVVAVTSAPMALERPGATFAIKGWAQITTGTNVTTVTVRIRRGATISGTLVGEANVITVGAAAGSNEQFAIMTAEQRADEGQAQYSLTIQQAGADGNGAILQSAIEVLQLS